MADVCLNWLSELPIFRETVQRQFWWRPMETGLTKYALELQEEVEKQGFVCVAAVAAIAEHSIMHQFAAKRPDGDKKELREFGEKIQQKIKPTKE